MLRIFLFTESVVYKEEVNDYDRSITNKLRYRYNELYISLVYNKTLAWLVLYKILYILSHQSLACET